MFPLIGNDELRELAEDIRHNGLIEPILRGQNPRWPQPLPCAEVRRHAGAGEQMETTARRQGP
jgi:hypothetical protein